MINYTRTINIDDTTKHRLSTQCKDNFLQFIMLQKAGKQGDLKMLNHLKTVYPKELKAKIQKNSTNIDYLKHHEQSEKILRQQAKFILTSRKNNNLTDRPRSRLDELIKRPSNLSPRCLLTTVDKFNI
ncbi:unnamed protein product [Paramecium pentaurelia]|uniref:Uncharacterized protein n=1 Tax=Paramecium pentaurelia TaxID=43138 RepID=A0A8S1XGL9_9CILI|nr:unnamed protein product [Paramecium pentaurelia]